jgi:hypothetical protein
MFIQRLFAKQSTLEGVVVRGLVSSIRTKTTDKPKSIKERLRILDDERVMPPEKPLTAFLSFSQRYRHSVPYRSVTEAAQKMGEIWRELPESEKQSFIKIYEDDKRIYEIKYKQYLASLTSKDYAIEEERRLLLKKLGKRVGRIRDPTKPKKPLTSYLRFSQHIRSSDAHAASLPVTQMAKYVSQKWAILSEDEKQKYKDAYDEDMKRFRQQTEE